MDIRVAVQPFRRAFEVVNKYVKVEKDRPIYSTAKLTVGRDSAHLIGVNQGDGVAIRCEVQGIECREPGEVLLPKDVIARILQSSDDETIQIWTDGSRLNVKATSAKWWTNTEPSEKFGEPRFDAEVLASCQVLAADFAGIVQRTGHACTMPHLRYALGGICIELANERLVALAADGNRAVLTSCPADISHTSARTYTPVIPIGSAKLAVSTFDASDLLTLDFTKQDAIVTSASATAAFRLLEGTFPIPLVRGACEGNLIASTEPIECKLFLQAIRQVAAVGTGSAQTTLFAAFDFRSDCLTLTSIESQQGGSTVEFPVVWMGEECRIGLPPEQIQTVIGSLGSSVFSLGINENGQAIVRGENCVVGIMPMKVQPEAK